MDAIRTAGLTHRFSADTVLRGVDLTVPAGSIYGFLGPNGAGKTTTLRLILGLLRRQAGTIEIFGQTLERHRLALLRRISCCSTNRPTGSTRTGFSRCGACSARS